MLFFSPMTQPLRIGDALRFAWEGTKKNFWFLLGLFVLFYVVQFGSSLFLIMVLGERSEWASLVNMLISGVANVILGTGSAALALKICDNQKPKLGDFICEGRVLGFYFLSLLILTPLLVIGFILLIFPGVYLAVRLGQTTYFIVEQKDNPIDALQKSWAVTQGRVGELIVYYLALFGIVLGGFLLFLVGVIPAWFVAMISSAYVYRVLSQSLMTPKN